MLTWQGVVGDPNGGLGRRPWRTLRGVLNGVDEHFGVSILISGVASGDILGALSSVYPAIQYLITDNNIYFAG